MTLEILEWNTLDTRARQAALARPALEDRDTLVALVRETVARVRAEGDAAALDYARRFDGGAPAELRVSSSVIDAAVAQVGEDAINALRRAIDNVRRFHSAQMPANLSIETSPGVRCERIFRPIEAVGLYVPGGSAPLPSALIMSAVPAEIAGCGRRILCTPGTRAGRVDPVILATARLCGVEEVFALGGAQAIAAMAYGTQSIPKVDKIFGPGSAWVTAAKQIVAEDPAGAALDLPAGPSEVLVIADDHADAEFVASDLLAQAEHDPLSQAILLTPSATLARRVRECALGFLGRLSRRNILEKSLERSRIIIVPGIDAALEISNSYAPEHLILQVREPKRWLARVSAAGSVFLGPWSPEPLGDYCSGTNHVLPTYGYARAYSGLSVTDFQRRITVQEISASGLADLGPTATTLAGLEGLDAHALAVNVRLERLARERSQEKPAADDKVVSFDPTQLARPSIIALRAYEHAHWDPRLERLHANEAPWPPVTAADSTLNRYPEPQPASLVTTLATYYGVRTEQILVGRGSDEAIDLLTRAFCESGRDTVIVCPPTFGMYAVAANAQGARVIEAPLTKAFTLDVEGITRALDDGAKIVWICSPNNPTGNRMPTSQIATVLEKTRGRAIVVIDEAYAEFCPERSWIDRLADHPHLVVLRTLSKAHALAGARIGVAVAAPAIIGLLRKLIPPYALTTDSIVAAERALSPVGLAAMRVRIDTLRRERDRVANALDRSRWVKKIFPSDANFLLVETSDAATVESRIVASGMIVRNFTGRGGLGEVLRITIGTEAQNDRVLSALEAYAEN